MELLYVHEHLSCFNYEKEEKLTIEKVELKKNQSKKEYFSIDNKVLFLMEGHLLFSYGEMPDNVLPEGKFIIFPAGKTIRCEAKEDCKFIVMRLYNTKQLCDCFPLDVLMREATEDLHIEPYFLDLNERTKVFIDFLNVCLSDGLKCTYYFELKVKEFYFMLRAYYTKKDLQKFFYPILSLDISFSDFIIKNHYKAKTVQELANLTHYSLSGFQKRFKKVFGVSAYNWMKNIRSKSIYHQINSTGKSFKEISDEYGFSSPSHFNDFCKTNFGTTPGRIRNKRLQAKD